MGCRVICFFAALLTICLVGDIQAQCEGISVVQDGLFLTITHDVEYNCAVTDMTHQVILEGTILHVVEVALATDWAICMCPYFSEVEVGGLPAGSYTLLFDYAETLEGEDPPAWTYCEMPFEIQGEAILSPDEIMVSVGIGGCGISTTGVTQGQGEQEVSWTGIKGLFQ